VILRKSASANGLSKLRRIFDAYTLRSKISLANNISVPVIKKLIKSLAIV